MHCHLQATLDIVVLFYEGLMRTITNWSHITDLALLSAGIQPEAAALYELGSSEKKMPLTAGMDLKGSSIDAVQWKCERESFTSFTSGLCLRDRQPRSWHRSTVHISIWGWLLTHLTPPFLSVLLSTALAQTFCPSPCLRGCNEHVHALHQVLEQRRIF